MTLVGKRGLSVRGPRANKVVDTKERVGVREDPLKKNETRRLRSCKSAQRKSDQGEEREFIKKKTPMSQTAHESEVPRNPHRRGRRGGMLRLKRAGLVETAFRGEKHGNGKKDSICPTAHQEQVENKPRRKSVSRVYFSP